jgi:HD-like signal output (HDOD) protein
MRRTIADISAAIALVGFSYVVLVWGSVLSAPAIV